uniref:Uncharacterized protein n=1 Tax=Myoviridae sp. ct0f722 TaxID=2827599 RepID=A0A8S5LQ17_9CAUD|nr:MAG TPA: hypothetical protein [Myoviridae sp. ct0f722]
MRSIAIKCSCLVVTKAELRSLVRANESLDYVRANESLDYVRAQRKKG